MGRQAARRLLVAAFAACTAAAVALTPGSQRFYNDMRALTLCKGSAQKCCGASVDANGDIITHVHNASLLQDRADVALDAAIKARRCSYSALPMDPPHLRGHAAVPPGPCMLRYGQGARGGRRTAAHKGEASTRPICRHRAGHV